MKNQYLVTSACMILVAITISNCRKSTVRPDYQTSETHALPPKTLSDEDMRNLPESVHGRSLPLDLHSGLVFGLTPDSNQNCNFELANSLKEKFFEKLKIRILNKKSPFFIAMAVNLEHLNFAKKVGARFKLKSDTAAEIDAFAKNLNSTQAEIANQNILVFNDTNKSLHEAFNITVPHQPSATTPISVTIVGQGGMIFERFSISATGDALDGEVERILTSLQYAETTSSNRLAQAKTTPK
jgi:hypothetical protein